MGWFDLLKDLPKVFFVFVYKSLVIWIFRMSSTEWLVFHCHEKQSSRCCKNISFNPIVFPRFLGDCSIFLNSFALSLFNFP